MKTQFLQAASSVEDVDDAATPPHRLAGRANGIVVLLTVPLAWGTYGPVVKYLYTIDPPIPGLVFSAAYYFVAAVTLWTLVGISSLFVNSRQKSNVSSSIPEITTPTNASKRSIGTALVGGMELGGYLFLGNLVQVLALRTVPADRAGFLVQLTTILVPFLDAGINRLELPVRTWGACWIALAGVICLEFDTATAVPAGGISTGDALMLGSAVFYSLHVVRLGTYAAKTEPLELAACKATFETVLSIGIVALLWQGDFITRGSAASSDIQTFLTAALDGTLSYDDAWGPTAVGAVLWTGWITCAYTNYAQSYGQQRVKPTAANLIYTVQPIFTALFAFLLLGETIGTNGLVGGALILAAVYGIGSAPLSSPKKVQDTSVVWWR